MQKTTATVFACNFLRSDTSILFGTAVRDHNSVLDCGFSLCFFSWYRFWTAFTFGTVLWHPGWLEPAVRIWSSLLDYGLRMHLFSRQRFKAALRLGTALYWGSRQHFFSIRVITACSVYRLRVLYMTASAIRYYYTSICTSICFVISKATKTTTSYRGLRAHCIWESTINIVCAYIVLCLKL